MIYIMSDECFFSLGVKAIFNSAGEDIAILPFATTGWCQQFANLGNDDILLLAVESTDLAGRILNFLSGKEIRICLFVKITCGYEYFTGHHGIVSRCIPPSMVIFAVRRAVSKNALRHITEKLTPSERLVMDNLSNGMSVAKIAQFLNVKEKQVYNHKKQAINRMGISMLKNKAVSIYSCLNLNVPAKMIGI